ncbi:MAG: FecR family protein [Polyangiaceae bacterium]|nr:FecR family protein [Polyangiaceae bacterium]
MDTWRDKTAEQWVQALGESEPEARDSVPNLGNIARLTSLIETEHANHARRLRLRRFAYTAAAGVLSLAAAAALWLRGSSPTIVASLAEIRAFNHAVSLEGGPPEMALKVGKQLTAGDTLVTGQAASATLSVAGGGTLELSAFSELRLLGAVDSERLVGARLGRGGVEVDLPKQPIGEHFTVSTPDAKVTVVGTKFNVRVAEGSNGPVTCVSVTHGRVRVGSAERQALLGAGERWVSRGESSLCDGARLPTSSMPAQAQPEPTAVESPSTNSGARRAGLGSAASGEAKTGTLAEENQLFLELLQARRDARNAEARALQRKFLTRYPASALAAQVREEQSKTP